MKIAGYVPDLESVLHNVGEELKERLLLWHSKKLAIAYGQLKLPEGMPTRVFFFYLLGASFINYGTPCR